MGMWTVEYLIYKKKYSKSGYRVNDTTLLHHLENGSCGKHPAWRGSLSPCTGGKDAGRPWPRHICTSICTGRSRAGTSLCSCTWWWEPCEPEEEAATERWKTLSGEKKVSLHQATLGSHQAGSWGTCSTLSACSSEPALACLLILPTLDFQWEAKSEGGSQKQKLGLRWKKYGR